MSRAGSSFSLTEVGHGPGEGHLDVLGDDGDVLGGDLDVDPRRELEVPPTARLPVLVLFHVQQVLVNTL